MVKPGLVPVLSDRPPVKLNADLVFAFRKMPVSVSVIGPVKVTVPPVRFWMSIDRPALLLMVVVAGNVTGRLPPFIKTSAPPVLVNATSLTVSPAGATPVAAPTCRPVVPPVTLTSVGAGNPVAVTVNVPGVPTAKLAENLLQLGT